MKRAVEKNVDYIERNVCCIERRVGAGDTNCTYLKPNKSIVRELKHGTVGYRKR